MCIRDRAWDLSRKRDGLFILPPFGNSVGEFSNRIETLYAINDFFLNSKEEYVLLSDCDTVCNIDFQPVINSHIERNADITLVYKNGPVPEKGQETVALSLLPTGQVAVSYTHLVSMRFHHQVDYHDLVFHGICAECLHTQQHAG